MAVREFRYVADGGGNGSQGFKMCRQRWGVRVFDRQSGAHIAYRACDWNRSGGKKMLNCLSFYLKGRDIYICAFVLTVANRPRFGCLELPGRA